MRPNPIAGRPLHDPIYEPLWAAAAELDAAVAIHEGTTLNVVQSGYDRFGDFAYRHACSHPHEQQIACLSFTCAGILERHPDLRVVFLESGCGWIAWWLERLDEHMNWIGGDHPAPADHGAAHHLEVCTRGAGVERVVHRHQRREVLVQRRRRHTQATGDLGETETVHPLLGHDRFGEVEDLLDRLLSTPGTPVGLHVHGH